MPEDFEDKLWNLIAEQRDAGVDDDQIISALEIVRYALQEEQHEE